MKTPLKKGVVVGALDETDNTIQSAFLTDVCLKLSQQPDWLKNVPTPEVVVSSKVSPGSASNLLQDDFMSSFTNAWKQWSIPRWTEQEIASLIQYLRKARVLVTSLSSTSREERELADKQLAQRVFVLSGGVGRRAFMAATEYRAPGTSPKVITQKFKQRQ
jgi:hypothetical protein